MNASEELVANWIEQSVSLDYVLEETALTEKGLLTKQYKGQCVVKRPSKALITLNTRTGRELTFKSDIGFVIEPYTDRIEGYQIQVRTPNYKARLLLKTDFSN
jgi:hypothetical protein